jgi:hypothetical protein
MPAVYVSLPMFCDSLSCARFQLLFDQCPWRFHPGVGLGLALEVVRSLDSAGSCVVERSLFRPAPYFARQRVAIFVLLSVAGPAVSQYSHVSVRRHRRMGARC